MSSLRVSAHAHSRSIGQAAHSGDPAARLPVGADDTGFADALGSAAAGRRSAADAPSDDRPADGSASRRGDRSPSAAADGAIAAAVLMALPAQTAAAPDGTASGGGATADQAAVSARPSATGDIGGGALRSVPGSRSAAIDLAITEAATATSAAAPDAEPLSASPQPLLRADADAVPEPMLALSRQGAPTEANAIAADGGNMQAPAVSLEASAAFSAMAQTVGASLGRAQQLDIAAQPAAFTPASFQPDAIALMRTDGPEARLSPQLRFTGASEPIEMAPVGAPPSTGAGTAGADSSTSGSAGGGADGSARLLQGGDRQLTGVAMTDAATSHQAPASPAPAVDTASPGIPPAGPGPSPGDQIMDALVRLTASGSREIVVRLHPAELGDVTVRIALSGRDISAWFLSPQPQVQHAIGDAMGQLQAGLGSAGYNLSEAWVGADASNARRHGAGDTRPATASAAPATARPAAIAAERPAASGMSIYV
jgi:flagellar hook-length control protein FliK